MLSGDRFRGRFAICRPPAATSCVGPESPQPPDRQLRTTQRKPMWHVDVSTVSRLAGGRPVAQAVVRRAQVRAALDHRRGIRARRPMLPGAARVRGHAARVRRLVGVRREAVGRPLPDVAGHVVEAVAVGRERPDRRGALVAVRAAGSATGTRPARCWPSCRPFGRELVAPGEDRRRRARRAPRTPTRPRSAAPCRPRRRRPRRPRRRRA